MKNIIQLETKPSDRYGDYYHSFDIVLKCDQHQDEKLVAKIDKELERLKRLSSRNINVYMVNHIHVDWGTFAYYARQKKAFLSHGLGSYLQLTFKVTGNCKVLLQSPPLHINTKYLEDPEYKEY